MVNRGVCRGPALRVSSQDKVTGDAVTMTGYLLFIFLGKADSKEGRMEGRERKRKKERSIC